MKNLYIILLFLGFSLWIGAQTTAPTSNSQEVGITEGQLSVSLSGAATYSIPIAVPPGINGVVPQVSLVYNSQGGNGWAGYGWNISGISAITRIPRTKFHDGMVGGINLDANDRFAIDGQRLIVKNNDLYGAANTEYETENFSNLKITAIGVSPLGANYGPASFLVEYPDGSKAVYGATLDAVGSRSITTWSITYWENPQGVRISYFYTLANNLLRLASINYGSTGTNATINKIELIYRTIPRQRPEESYIGGQRILMDKILSDIKVWGNNEGFRNYVLAYDITSLGYERLERITEKSGDGTKSYNPTVFSYGGTTNAALFKVNAANSTLSLSNINAQNAGTVIDDFDGDGKNDFILFAKTGPDAYNKCWIYDDIDGNGFNFGYTHPVGVFTDIFTTSFLKGDSSNGYKVNPRQGWTVARNNVNNYTFDVYALIPASAITGYNFLPALQYTKTVSFPTEIVMTSCNGSTNKIFSKKIISGDFNGDGITDIIAIDKPLFSTVCDEYNGNYEVAINSQKVYFVDLRKDSAVLSSAIGNINEIVSKDTKIEVIDFNNDGKSDFMVLSEGTVTVYTLGTTNNLVVLTTYRDAGLSSSKPCLLGDYNGDGKTDFVIPQAVGQDNWNFYQATGASSGFIKSTKAIGTTYKLNYTQETYVNGWEYQRRIDIWEFNYFANDVNGDGKTDIVLLQNRSLERIDNYGNAWGRPRYESSDYTGRGNPIESFVMLCQNLTTASRGLHFSYNAINTSGIHTYPIPLITNHSKLNLKLEFSLLTNNTVYTYTCTKDNRLDTQLEAITTGNGVTDRITYKPLVEDDYNYYRNSVYTSALDKSFYPNKDITIDPSFQVVSMLEKQSSSVYKKQLFSYAGATSNLEGLGFLGFRASMRTNWFDDTSTEPSNNQIISSVSKFDPNLRGAYIENYTYLGFVEPATTANAPTAKIPRTSAHTINTTITTNDTLQATNSIRFLPGARIAPTGTNIFKAQITPDYDANGFAETNTSPPTNLISKSLSFYESNLSASKVFTIKNTQSNTYNILDNTSGETVTVYDDKNNPVESISKVRNAGVGEQTTITAIGYKSPSTTPYLVGRPESKTQTVSSSGDSMTSKEAYGYGTGTESNLLKTIERWGNNTSSIIEANVYDGFGNITQKTISAAGIKNRVTNYKYEPTGRFLEESYDIENLKTTYLYNPNGTLKSETNPYGLTTSYIYDSWFKKTQTTDYLGKITGYVYQRINNVNTIIKTTGADGSYSEEIFDDLGRKIHTGINDLQNNKSYIDFKYDVYDRKYSTSEPYYSGSTPTVYAGSLWNTTTYDVYGRPETATDFSGKVISIKYGKLTTTTTDGSTLTTKKATKNAIGNLVQMEETPGGIIEYSYFANGNLKETNYGSNKITSTQDGWGRKTSLTDPSAGKYTYEYNALGESTKETTPNGTTTIGIDDWGKPQTKTIVGTNSNTNSNTVYTYYPDSKLPLKTTYTDTNDGGKRIITEYTYDDKKRLKTITENMDYGAEFIKILSYDNWGRVDIETSTANLNGKTSTTVIQNEYNNGFAYKIKDVKNPLNLKTLWQTNTVNARGQLLTANLGSGIAITNGYDTYGFPSLIKHDKTGTSPGNIMTLITTFDEKKGNLKSRDNNMFGWTEDFTNSYDNLDRLTSWKNAQGAIVNQSYKPDGRIDVNTLGKYNYTYKDKIYQNTSVEITTLIPDVLTYYKAKSLQTISYNTFKSPVRIEEKGVDIINFVYNDNNDRSAMFYGSPNVTLLPKDRPNQKYYSADGSMEIKITPTNTEFVTYIAGDGYSAPVVYKKTFDTAGATQEQMLYLHRDYQGSILAITDANAVVLEKRLFDAWGEILKVQNGGGFDLNVLTILDRGYTGHEHLQIIGLINMNGRIYDPKLHRFLQPDNFVQDPTNTQNYNRYSYVLNNPLKYTDPSGEETIIRNGNCPCEQPPYDGPNFNGALYNWLESQKGGDGWLGRNFSARNFDEAGTAVGKAFRDAGNFVYGGIARLFAGYGSAPTTQVMSNANTSFSGNQSDVHMPTQHSFLGVNMTALSEGNFLQQMAYETANGFNIIGQYLMGRSVGDYSMRNLNGSASTTDEAVSGFTSAGTMLIGGEGTISSLKRISTGGKSFAQYRTDYWLGKTKPVLEPLQNEATGQVWKQYMELHHRFIPQRWKWAPNWLKNNRFNLQEVNSLQHALKDPYRARFAPKWVKEKYNLFWK